MRTPSKLLPDVDYTIDGGKIILTESFLLRRGFCCNTRCRHCPYKGERASAPIVILGLPKTPLVVPPRVATVTAGAGASPRRDGPASIPAAAAAPTDVTVPPEAAERTA